MSLYPLLSYRMSRYTHCSLCWTLHHRIPLIMSYQVHVHNTPFLNSCLRITLQPFQSRGGKWRFVHGVIYHIHRGRKCQG